ncbi:hypothetical protein WMW72_06105 [Paenibacillus filicis]|uniref:Uncharacterized protein n=1 Tax=Paenibacillus filicis TaxID=669464 RepID=A0ABU9DHD3_9BACL
MGRMEIKTISEYNYRKGQKNGYIIITDKPLKRAIIHRTTCPNLEERYLKQKVIDNNNKYGNYFWITNTIEADELHAEWCLHCK